MKNPKESMRGKNPNSRKALNEYNEKYQFNAETARKANQKSIEKRRALKTFRELDEEHTTEDERLEMLNSLKRSAKRGNLHAFEIYRDTMGMKPTENVNVSALDPDAIKEVEEFMYGIGGGAEEASESAENESS